MSKSINNKKNVGKTAPVQIPGIARYLVGPAFLLLAAWFVIDPVGTQQPAIETIAVAPNAISITPLRAGLTDPPLIKIGGFERDCMDCHRIIDVVPKTDSKNAEQRFEHKEIVMQHGRNDQCFNCHDNVDRNRLWIRAEKTVPFSDSATLCSKCHSSVYRNWEAGIHGKTLGYWDKTQGTPERLTCVQCHDPHSPAFEKMVPLPGPNTLRMGEIKEHREDHESPLLHWINVSKQKQKNNDSVEERPTH